MKPQPLEVITAMEDPNVVDLILDLARISLQADEKKQLAKELRKILDAMDLLKSVDTTRTPPTSHPHEMAGILEDDHIRPGLVRTTVLSSAPDPASGRYFRVPPVLDGDDS